MGLMASIMYFRKSRSPGPDSIPTYILELCARDSFYTTNYIFSIINERIPPSDWLQGNAIPIYKKGDRTIPINYRSVSLTFKVRTEQHTPRA